MQGLVQAVLEAVGVGPREVGRVAPLPVMRIESVTPRQGEPVFDADPVPSHRAAAPAPPRRIGKGPVDGTQPVIVQFSLLCHVFYGES